jgi:hypothetical protein
VSVAWRDRCEIKSFDRRAMVTLLGRMRFSIEADWSPHRSVVSGSGRLLRLFSRMDPQGKLLSTLRQFTAAESCGNASVDVAPSERMLGTKAYLQASRCRSFGFPVELRGGSDFCCEELGGEEEAGD